MSAETAAGLGLATILAIGVSQTWLSESRRAARAALARRRAHKRAERAEAASVEASLEEPVFAPEHVRRAIEHLLALGQVVWRAGETRLIAERVDGAAIESWARGWQRTLGPEVRLVGKPKIDLQRVVNRPGEDEDRVVARVRWSVRRQRFAATERLDERWTLGCRGKRLIMLATEGNPLSGTALTEELIPEPSADTERLREQSLRELADADAAPAEARLADLVDKSSDPDSALRDLGLVDGRFAPPVIESALHHLVEVWEEASVGSAHPLNEVASKEAAAALLHTPRGRLRIRDAALLDWQCVGLQPPRARVAVRLNAVRYLVDEGSGAFVAGDDLDASVIDLEWTLALTPTGPVEWELVATEDPARGIPRA